MGILTNEMRDVVMDDLSIKFRYYNEKVQYLDCKFCNRLLPISKFNLVGKNHMNPKEGYEKCNSCKRIAMEEERKKHIESMDAVTIRAEMAYQSMRQRCGSKTRTWYTNVMICEEWLENKQSFIQWYRENYYEIAGNIMIVDKDLFGENSKLYSPQTACILPQTINAMISNLKRHRFLNKEIGMRLPLAVYYNKYNDTFFSRIKYYGSEKVIQLSYHSTPEEAFEEYRLEKKKDIKRMADMYKAELPVYVYEALLRFEIKPY